MSKHESFILTPITSVLEEMIAATSRLDSGIETYPLWDYILQSTFTKMTGFQEQKMKCIDWELATNGYDYRRSFLEDVKNRGTYSTYESKQTVYNALLGEIARYSRKSKKDIVEQKTKNGIDPRGKVQSILDDTNVKYCKQREYASFTRCKNQFRDQYWIVPKDSDKTVKLFESRLCSYYKDDLYRHRNRIAHNTLSYQQNLPELESLKNETEYSRNYFFWFAILVLIDEIFMDLYREYLHYIKMNSYFEE